MSARFITATGTDVGKTVVACALAYQLRQRGRSVQALKPIITGYDGGETSDSHQLLRAMGKAPGAAAIDALSPWRFAEPLAPDQAAAHDGRAVDFEAIIGHCRAAMAGKADEVIIEGIGGALVPLAGSRCVADWIAALDIDCWLVTGCYLGTLSHTIATLEAMHARGLRVTRLVINAAADTPSGLSEQTAAALAPFAGAARITQIGFLGAAPEPWRRAPDLC